MSYILLGRIKCLEIKDPKIHDTLVKKMRGNLCIHKFAIQILFDIVDAEKLALVKSASISEEKKKYHNYKNVINTGGG
jgi:hypothetical protein